MSKLKLGTIRDDKPVKLAVELTAKVYRDLAEYTNIHGQEHGQNLEPEKLIGPMLERFMATDRGFAKARREQNRVLPTPGQGSSTA